MFLFDKDSFVRKNIFVWIAAWPIFDVFILICIFLNSAIMALQDFREPDKDSWNNNLVSITENIFNAIFIFEAVIKILAMGFVFGEGTYLTDPWNWLDFTTVLSSIIGYIGSASNLTFLRTFRLFRPLRSLTALDAMRKLLSTLMDSLSNLANIMALMFFFFIIFAIFGMTLWQGKYHQRCRLTPHPVDGVWPLVPGLESLCGNEICSNSWCGSN